MRIPLPQLLSLLTEGRRREKTQTLFYRQLAARAADEGREQDVERLNELHADEQHHLSRITARLLELGGAPADLSDVAAPETNLVDWEAEARRREGGEVAWYEKALTLDLDIDTRTTFTEIVGSERMHERDLRGKWMSA